VVITAIFYGHGDFIPEEMEVRDDSALRESRIIMLIPIMMVTIFPTVGSKSHDCPIRYISLMGFSCGDQIKGLLKLNPVYDESAFRKKSLNRYSRSRVKSKRNLTLLVNSFEVRVFAQQDYGSGATDLVPLRTVNVSCPVLPLPSSSRKNQDFLDGHSFSGAA